MGFCLFIVIGYFPGIVTDSIYQSPVPNQQIHTVFSQTSTIQSKLLNTTNLKPWTLTTPTVPPAVLPSRATTRPAPRAGRLALFKVFFFLMVSIIERFRGLGVFE
ncbi:hypothetical protein VTN49DRAFT_68 [Thermomyces lanuginosus]|uniref:uncharacterized protein n=1 Tax=Thermomyces lanuginosus TaxID=5541 RepID=UPI003742B15C